MKLWDRFIGLFEKKECEYLYLCHLSAVTFEEKNQQGELQLRTQIIEKIKHDLAINHKKEIEFSDLYAIPKDVSVLLLFGSASPHSNLFIRPLMYEIYAYKEKRDEKIFSYPLKTLLFKVNNVEIKVLKFTIDVE